MTTTADPIVDQLYLQAKNWVEDEPLEAANVITFAARLIAVTQNVVREKAKGPYKKKVVLTILFRLVDESEDLSDDAKQHLRYILDTTVPPSIDTMISIGKGELDLAKNIQNIKKICC